jgi:AcrR family transcriptional regulator
VALALLAAEGVQGFTARKVASTAGTSTPAVYELFGDKGGLVRQVFFHGFQLLGARLERLRESGDPRADLVATIGAFREFVRANPVLAEVMFSRPVADFRPGPDEARAGVAVREFVVGRVRRCVDVGILAGDPADIAHVLLAAAQGLAAQETAGWLGTSKASVDRRWALGIRAMLDGLKPA